MEQLLFHETLVSFYVEMDTKGTVRPRKVVRLMGENPIGVKG